MNYIFSLTWFNFWRLKSYRFTNLTQITLLYYVRAFRKCLEWKSTQFICKTLAKMVSKQENHNKSICSKGIFHMGSPTFKFIQENPTDTCKQKFNWSFWLVILLIQNYKLFAAINCQFCINNQYKRNTYNFFLAQL